MSFAAPDASPIDYKALNYYQNSYLRGKIIPSRISAVSANKQSCYQKLLKSKIPRTNALCG